MTLTEKTYIKVTIAVFLGLLIFFGTLMYNIGRKQEQMEQQILMHEKDDKLIKDDVEKLKDESDAMRIQYAEIKVKLSSIESTLLEIKNDLKSHDSVR